MRVLLDTNIIILREDNKVVPESVQKLLANLSYNKADILTHPLSKKDLANDRNEERKAIVLSKIGGYQCLNSYPDFVQDGVFRKTIGWNGNEHGFVDMQLLYAVYKNAVDLLITRDVGIHRLALRLGIDDKIYDVEEALAVFPPPKEDWRSITLPLEEVDLWKIDLADPIFKELLADYPEFEVWWRKKSCEGRKAIINRLDNGRVGAILMLKVEDEHDAPSPSTPPLDRKRRLKICTFKVVNNGNYLGELFIRMSIQKAIETGCDEIYFTHFDVPDDPLIALTKQYGFEHWGVVKGKYARDEAVFVKWLLPNGDVTGLPPQEINRIFFPSFYDGPSVKKALVPILPEYHERLFGNSDPGQSRLDKYMGAFIPEQNTIKKAYISRARTRLKAGDLLLFYRSEDMHAVTSIGVVESAQYGVKDADAIQKMASRRTVYSRSELEDYAKNGATVILFRHCFDFKNRVSMKELINELSIAVPQSITLIDNGAYTAIMGRSGLDGRFIIH